MATLGQYLWSIVYMPGRCGIDLNHYCKSLSLSLSLSLSDLSLSLSSPHAPRPRHLQPARAVPDQPVLLDVTGLLLALLHGLCRRGRLRGRSNGDFVSSIALSHVVLTPPPSSSSSFCRRALERRVGACTTRGCSSAAGGWPCTPSPAHATPSTSRDWSADSGAGEERETVKA